MKPLTHRSGALRSASFDPDTNTIEVVFTTGAAVRRIDPLDGTEFDEVLSLAPGAVRLDRLNAGAPFCDSHATDRLAAVLGSVVPGSARIEGARGSCRIQLSRAPGVADTVLKIREGVIRNVSVGYWTHRAELTERPDDVLLLRVTDWEPLEISAVPVPADAGSQIRAARRTLITSTKARPMTKLSAARRVPMTPARRRAEIRRLATLAGHPALGEAAAAAGVPVRQFRDTLLDAMIAAEEAARIAPRPRTESEEILAAEKHWKRAAQVGKLRSSA